MNTPQEFADLLAGFRRLESSGFAGGAALATLTRTQGSTFRRAGARMLICGDGTIVRGLSGGCPEADIITQARDVIAEQRARVVSYNREHGLDVLIEMGCGGELEVLIEPLAAAEDLRFVDAVAHCLSTRSPGFLATAFARDGVCLLPRPRRLAWSDGATYDDLGDAALSAAVIRLGSAANGHAQPVVETIATNAGMTDVLIERLRPPHALALIGVSASALALALLASQLGWVTTLVDHRYDQAAPADLPASTKFVIASPDALRQRLAFDRRSSVVVMTHNFERDIAYLTALRDAPLAYLGAIGSRARSAKLHEATGLSAAHLRAPAGLDLGSETPEEIALAIAAEILAVTTGHSGGVLSAVSSPIH